MKTNERDKGEIRNSNTGANPNEENKVSKSQRITEWNNLKILDNKFYHRKFFILLIVSNLLAFTNPSKFVFEISSIVFLIIPKLKTLNCLNK